jgi:hypothetical protein
MAMAAITDGNLVPEAQRQPVRPVLKHNKLTKKNQRLRRKK